VPTFLQPHSEVRLGLRPITVRRAPLLIRRVQAACRHDRVWIYDAALRDEIADAVHVISVLRRGRGDRARGIETVTLPRETAVDRPAKDSRELLLELLRELPVLFLRRDRDLEWDEVHATPDRVVGPVNLWPVIDSEE